MPAKCVLDPTRDLSETANCLKYDHKFRFLVRYRLDGVTNTVIGQVVQRMLGSPPAIVSQGCPDIARESVL